ncbi:MAG: MoaD/ThiS family protein [Desulfatibacillaceae bacterium]
MDDEAHIEFRCFATLGGYQPENADRFPVVPGETAGDVIRRVGLPLDEVNTVFVNGRQALMSQRLEPGDRIGVFPKVGGG